MPGKDSCCCYHLRYEVKGFSHINSKWNGNAVGIGLPGIVLFSKPQV